MEGRVKKLLIDAGNSSLKWALLDSNNLSKMESISYQGTTPVHVFSYLLENLLNTINIKSIVIVSVLGDKYESAVNKITLNLKLHCFFVSSSAQLAGVVSAYNQPHKLGTDRLVAMVAAHHLYKTNDIKNHATIIIDSGTATTIDAIDANGLHLGGLILPGLDLCGLSLLKNTEMLAPFTKEAQDKNIIIDPSVFSTDTTQAIYNGSIFGLIGAIEKICTKMEEEIKHKDFHKTQTNKLICGGGADKLLPYFSQSFNHQDDLVMQGLKIISDINEKQH